VLLLVEIDIGIGIVHQRVQKIECLVERHLTPIKSQKLRPLLLHEIVRLVTVVLAIELAHRVAGRIIVVAIILFGLPARLGIDLRFDEFFPRLHRIV
jgi:hypothetical protein